jgi:hypothetical protein
MREPSSRFSVRIARRNRRSHKFMRKSGLVLQSPARKWFFKGQIARSAEFAMDAWWDQLKRNFLLDKVILEDYGAFIVEVLELGTQSSENETIVNCLEGFQDVSCGFGRRGVCVDSVAVVVVQYKYLGVAATGSDRKTPGLVGIYLSWTLSWHDGGKSRVCDGGR